MNWEKKNSSGKKRTIKRKKKVNHYFHPECLKKQCTVKMAWESVFFFFCNCNCSLQSPRPSTLCPHGCWTRNCPGYASQGPTNHAVEWYCGYHLRRSRLKPRFECWFELWTTACCARHFDSRNWLFIVINQCCMPILTPEASANGIQNASEFRNWVVTFSFFWWNWLFTLILAMIISPWSRRTSSR